MSESNVVQFNSTKALLERIAELENELDLHRNPNVPTSERSAAPIAVNLPSDIPSGDLGFEDISAAFNMRDWLKKACEAQGARMTGGGFGFGEADISIELEGHGYWLTIKPIQRS